VAGLRRQPPAQGRPDRRARPAPVQDHRRRRRGGREVSHFYKQLPQHPLREGRHRLPPQRKPTDAQLAEISKKFSDIKVKGEFRVTEPLPVEKDEPTLAHLHRLVFTFNRADHGRLRMLINHLNDLKYPHSASLSC
jgi:hypothetical protein